jgi:hypothetical protein
LSVTEVHVRARPEIDSMTCVRPQRTGHRDLIPNGKEAMRKLKRMAAATLTAVLDHGRTRDVRPLVATYPVLAEVDSQPRASGERRPRRLAQHLERKEHQCANDSWL